MGRFPSVPEADRYRDWNPRSGIAREKSLPFGKAMKWLYEELKAAETFYQKFLMDYENEIKPISYASGEVKRKIWNEKVSGKKAPAGGQNSGQDKSVGKREEKFADKQNSMRDAMEAALNASLKLGDDEAPKVAILEARRRLQEKVELASHQVMGLISSAIKASEHCKVLVDELKQLMNLVDPMKNKHWFEEGNGGNVDGSGGQYHGGSNDYQDDYDQEDGNNDGEAPADW